MADIAIVTLKQSDYNLIVGHLSLLDIVPISVKILPDDKDIKDIPIYKDANKKYKEAQKYKETVAFNLTTNK